MKRYLVKLTPHDRFFFGGESTFGEGNSRNYFVKSNYYPQQTSLLGLVRYQFLAQSNDGIFKDNKIQNKEEATKLIGKKSFSIIDNEFKFGKILNLSPLLISDSNNNFLFPANKEYQWVKQENKFKLREFDKYMSGCSSLQNEFIPYLKEYKAKDELPNLLIDQRNKLYNYSDIFIEHKQTGIRKNYEGNTEENAFYIQTFIQLTPGYSFAFILELEEETEFKNQEIVILGAEQSKFKMDIDTFEIDFDQLIPGYEKSVNSPKVVLVSDAYTKTNDLLSACDFAITETVDFRSLETAVGKTENYSALDREKKMNNVVWKSKKYNFFKRGSVFYGNPEKIITHIGKEDTSAFTPLQKIGYNHFKIVDKKES